MCSPCVKKFCYCVSLEKGIIVTGIIKLIITIIILILSVVFVTLTKEKDGFFFSWMRNVFYTIMFFTSIFIIVMILALHGVKKKSYKIIIPYLVYGIIYTLAYLVVIAYTTPVLLIISSDEMSIEIDILAFSVTIIVAAFVGLCIQVYFYIVTYSFYKHLSTPNDKDSSNESADVEMLNY